VCVCVCVLSGRGLCDELITRPEESYRLWRVVVCDHINLVDEEAISRAGLQSQKKKCIFLYINVSLTKAILSLKHVGGFMFIRMTYNFIQCKCICWCISGLANFSPQESHAIRKDSPEGCMYVDIHRKNW
jgi:hypothetical protein